MGEKDHLECAVAGPTSLTGFSLFERPLYLHQHAHPVSPPRLRLHPAMGDSAEVSYDGTSDEPPEEILIANPSSENPGCDSARSEEGATLLSVSPQSRAPSRSRSEQRA